MGVNRFSAAKLSRHNLSSTAWAGQSAAACARRVRFSCYRARLKRGAGTSEWVKSLWSMQARFC
jgi:hypothetical protein